MTGRAQAGAIIEAVIDSHDATSGLTLLNSKAGRWYLPRLDAAAGSRVRIRVRARDVMLAKSAPHDISALNIFPAVIAALGQQEGPIVEVKLDCSGDAILARLTRQSVEVLGLARGVHVHAVIKSVALDRRSLSGPWKDGPVADTEAQEA